MYTYRLIFADNIVLACTEAQETSKLEGKYYYEHDRKRMLFAIVNAESKEEAEEIATQLVQEIQQE